MYWLLFIPFFAQTAIIFCDEFFFHIRRGLPRWERIGHPLDTLSVILCFAFALLVPFSSLNLKLYIALALFSCIFVTKDEFVHKECCPASEQWLHALLFINHPVVLTTVGVFWCALHGVGFPFFLRTLLAHQEEIRFFLKIQTLFIGIFFFYQVIYWNFVWKENRA